MTDVWVLYVCIAASNWGCGAWVKSEMTKQECFVAIKEIRSEYNGKIATGNEGKLTTAVCYKKSHHNN